MFVWCCFTDNELVNAAINVASHAGTKKKEVECDLLAKLGETIPGMKSTRSKKTKNAKKTQSINGDAFDVFRDIPNVLDGNLKKKKT